MILRDFQGFFGGFSLICTPYLTFFGFFYHGVITERIASRGIPLFCSLLNQLRTTANLLRILFYVLSTKSPKNHSFSFTTYNTAHSSFAKNFLIPYYEGQDKNVNPVCVLDKILLAQYNVN